jgi:leucyl-tRNA synthetase
VYKEATYPQYMAEGFLKLLNPIAPFITEELWEKIGHNNTISYESWPEYDDTKIQNTTKEIGVQVNGKIRATIVVNINDTEDILKDKALKEDNVKKYIAGKDIVKVIAIKGKIVNIVVK